MIMIRPSCTCHCDGNGHYSIVLSIRLHMTVWSCYSIIHDPMIKWWPPLIQEALLSQRGRAILRICIALIQNVERSLLLLVVSASDIPLRTIKFFSVLFSSTYSSRPSQTNIRWYVLVLEVDGLCSHVSCSHPYLTSTCPAGFWRRWQIVLQWQTVRVCSIHWWPGRKEILS